MALLKTIVKRNRSTETAGDADRFDFAADADFDTDDRITVINFNGNIKRVVTILPIIVI